jgi:hypothetical protein
MMCVMLLPALSSKATKSVNSTPCSVPLLYMHVLSRPSMLAQRRVSLQTWVVSTINFSLM